MKIEIMLLGIISSISLFILSNALFQSFSYPGAEYRSHEVCHQGFEWSFGPAGRCITVFSSSDYYGGRNKAAIVRISEDLEVDFIKFRPLAPCDTSNRKVLLPEWMIRQSLDAIPVALRHPAG
jgi:hypothetical protein